MSIRLSFWLMVLLSGVCGVVSGVLRARGVPAFFPGFITGIFIAVAWNIGVSTDKEEP